MKIQKLGKGKVSHKKCNFILVFIVVSAVYFCHWWPKYMFDDIYRWSHQSVKICSHVQHNSGRKHLLRHYVFVIMFLINTMMSKWWWNVNDDGSTSSINDVWLHGYLMKNHFFDQVPIWSISSKDDNYRPFRPIKN